MKTKQLLLLLILPVILGQGTKGQGYEFAPIGATWYYEYNNLLSYGYIKIESVGDTTIQTKNCKILQKNSFGYTYPGYYDTINMGKEHIYSDTNAVYYYRNNFFYTLFEFGPIGSSWNVIGNSMTNNSDSGIVYIDSIGVELINDSLRNIVFLKSTPQSCIGWHFAKVIEGIGVVNEYFFPDYIDCVVDANEGSAFRCFFIGDTLIYSTTTANNCNFINQIDENEIFEINIYPNPFENIFHVYMKNEQYIHNSYFEIFDIVGKKVNFNSFVCSNNSITVSIEDYPSGVLFLVIHTNENKIIKKIVKHYCPTKN